VAWLGKFLASTPGKQWETESESMNRNRPVSRTFFPADSRPFLLRGYSHAGGRWFDPSRAHRSTKPFSA
jgi:hypothetical protein